jgi:magnesium chelatase subunit I
LASTLGKIELESIEDGREEQVIENLLRRAVLNVFNRYLDLKQFDQLIAKFKTGLTIVVSDTMSSQEYVKRAREDDDLNEGIRRLGGDKNPATIASAVEFILEGLHLSRRLNKDRLAGKTQYRG